MAEYRRDRVRQNRATRSARLAAAREKGRHTEVEWTILLASLSYRCVNCGSDGNGDGGLTKDHIIPIYQGGSDAIDNIQPLCGRCNAAKGPDDADLRSKAAADWRVRYDRIMAMLRAEGVRV